MAVSSRLKDAIVTRINALGLTFGSGPSLVDVTIERKKAPKVERGLETTPLGQVTAAAQAGRNEWWDTGTDDTPRGRKRCEYYFEVNLIAKGNRDPSANDDTYDDWREEIGRAFEPPSVLGVDELFDVQIIPQAQYDREGFPRNYDQSRIILKCITIEPAAN